MYLQLVCTENIIVSSFVSDTTETLPYNWSKWCWGVIKYHSSVWLVCYLLTSFYWVIFISRDGPISHFWSDTDIRYFRKFRYPIIPIPIPIFPIFLLYWVWLKHLQSQTVWVTPISNALNQIKLLFYKVEQSIKVCFINYQAKNYKVRFFIERPISHQWNFKIL